MRTGALMIGLLAAGSFFGSSGCGPDCEDFRYCSDSLEVAVMARDGEVEDYQAEITVDGDTTTAGCGELAPDPDFSRCTSGRLLLRGTPEELEIQITTDGLTGGGVFTPSYVSYERRYDGCSTTCEKAQIVVNVN